MCSDLTIFIVSQRTTHTFKTIFIAHNAAISSWQLCATCEGVGGKAGAEKVCEKCQGRGVTVSIAVCILTALICPCARFASSFQDVICCE